MSDWFNYPMFKRKLKGYCDATGATHKDVAIHMGLSPSSFSKYLYPGGARQFSMDQLWLAAKLFNCSIYDFIIDPELRIPGIETEGLTNKGKMYAQLIIDKFRSDTSDDEDLELLYEDLLRNEDRIRSISSRKVGRPQRQD